MGYSTKRIPFMVMEDAKIEIESATEEYFPFTNLMQFAPIGGSFAETDKNPKTFIFEDAQGGFAEFRFV